MIKLFLQSLCCKCNFSTCKLSDIVLDKVRTVGLLAHVDAGKTTTTEQMLYTTGKINSVGEVNRGNTVTDFQELERKRGITINSAAVSMQWEGHRINLIDTPGHFDFSIEVEAAMTSINGAVVILDGTEGVEAQTARLWMEANKHNVPRIIYLNKLDRVNANFKDNINSIKTHFGSEVLPIHFPVQDSSGLKSIINVLTMEENDCMTDLNSKVVITENHNYYSLCHDMRMSILDTLSSIDDFIADKILSHDKLDVFSLEEIEAAVRRITLSQRAIPILVGSSFKGAGINELLDGIIKYLPSLYDTKIYKIMKHFKSSFCARVFKVLRDNHRGIITYIYILNGDLKKGDSVFSVLAEKTETIKGLAVPFANSFEEKEKAVAGEIIAVFGLKECLVGDFLCTSSKIYHGTFAKLQKLMNFSDKELDKILHGSFQVPTPVVYSYVEPIHQTDQTPLQLALNDLQREDPSLKLTQEGNQIVIGGQGNLHLEILKDKLKSVYNIEVNFSKPQISYYEVIAEEAFNIEHSQISSVSSDNMSIVLSLIKSTELKNDVIYEESCKASLEKCSPRIVRAVKEGILSSLSRGPHLHLPVSQVQVVVQSLDVKQCRSPSFVSSVAANCVKKALKEVKTAISEPVMEVDILFNSSVNSDIISIVRNDLNSKGAINIHDDFQGFYKGIKAVVPLRNLDEYFSTLQSLTSGRASLSIKYLRHLQMNSNAEAELVAKLTGL